MDNLGKAKKNLAGNPPYINISVKISDPLCWEAQFCNNTSPLVRNQKYFGSVFACIATSAYINLATYHTVPVFTYAPNSLVWHTA